MLIFVALTKADMTKITDYIQQANGKTLFSIEVIPPVKGNNINELLGNIEPLMDFKPPFIDVTYHREEYIEKPLADGRIQQIVTRKRPGTIGICASIMPVSYTHLDVYKRQGVSFIFNAAFIRTNVD